MDGTWDSPAIFRRGVGAVMAVAVSDNNNVILTVCYPPIAAGDAADDQETKELVNR